MLKRISTTPALAAVIAVLSACAPAGGTPTPTPPPTPNGPQGSLPENGNPKIVSPEGNQDQAIAAAKHDLAQKKGISEESITVTDVSQVDWPDSSLGCPEPGMVYAQIVIPGYRMILSANGEQYEYHTDSNGSRVVTCQSK